MISRGLHTLCFLILLNPVLWSQVSFVDYLQQALDLSTEETLDTIERDQIAYKSPFIRRWNVRMDTDEFQLERQEYELRGDLSSRAIRKYQNRLYESYQAELDLERSKTSRPKVMTIYEAWLDAFFVKKALDLNVSILPFLEDQRLMLSKIGIDGEVAVYDYLDVQRKLELLTWNIEKAERIIDTLRVDGASIVSIDQLSANVEALRLKLQLTYPDYTEDQLDLRRIEDEYGLEEARTNKILDFVRVNYNGPHTDLWEERVSVGVAMNIGRSEKRELDLVELRFDQELELEQIKQRQLDFRRETETALLKFRKANDAYNSFVSLLGRLESFSVLADQQRPSNKRDIIKWLDLKIEEIKAQHELIKLEENVYTAYLGWLDTNGLFELYPTLNFLDSNLEIPILGQ